MHVLFVHQNFPAQFGHIAGHLVERLKWECSFLSETPPGTVGGIRKIQYQTAGGATKANHFCSRTFENTIWHCDAAYHALRPLKDLRPDLIVGHSGFGSTLYLRELYPDVPIINFFEYFYRPHDANSDMDFRKDLGWALDDQKYLRSRTRNAMILLDLNNCQLGYSPTDFQRTRFPDEYQGKLRTCFDGIDRRVYHGHGESLRPAPSDRGTRTIAGVEVPADARVVTYCARGFESMRGFDIFMRAAKIICERDPRVIFLVAGTDRVAYGGDEQYLKGQTFKEWTLAQQPYDLSRIKFLGRVDPRVLAEMLAAGDLHMYLTVPFVLSWSMMDAMSAGAVVLGSRTAPVEEMIRDGENGLLADFFSPEEFAEKALQVLADPAAYRPLGRAAERMIEERYSLEAVTPQMLKLYEDAAQTKAGLESPRPRAPEAPRQVMQQPAADAQQRPQVASPIPSILGGTPAGPARPGRAVPPVNLKPKPSGNPFFG